MIPKEYFFIAKKYKKEVNGVALEQLNISHKFSKNFYSSLITFVFANYDYSSKIHV